MLTSIEPDGLTANHQPQVVSACFNLFQPQT